MILIHIPKTAGTSIQKALGPTSIGHKKVSKAKGDSFFTCVRNPYDRAVSIYWFIRKIKKKLPFNITKTYKSLDEFWLDVSKDGVSGDRGLLHKQIDFLRDDITKGGISPRIKTVLRYETLADDWPAFAAKHNLPVLEHKNKSHQRPAIPWQEELSDESIAIIGELYADDFEHLNYERIS